MVGGMPSLRRFVAASLLLVIGAVATAWANPPASFRRFKVYTTSAPDPADPAHIVATMRLLNGSPAALDVHVSLAPNVAAGFAGKQFDLRIETGKEAACAFELRPPDGLAYEVLSGAIAFGNANAPPERELFIAVQGPDPADFPDKGTQRIAARAQVVGTHAP